MNPEDKYRAFPQIALAERAWPDAVLTEPPVWCSVDLRDGNQALVDPMGSERKLRLFKTLTRLGFREIEVGFPSASRTDYEFIRLLIEKNLIPEDVTIQVLTQSRKALIEKTFEAIEGCRRAIVHLYNSTSPLQRRVVFKEDKAGITKIAVDGACWVKDLGETYQSRNQGTELRYQYSPESFSSTEMDYAVEICSAVVDVFAPEKSGEKTIINLPATVEMSTPNIHADQIEYFCRHVPKREHMIISLHPHNDRGTAVAATELALMAGGERVEGTLFGNGERTGNVDLITLALNLYTQGIEPGLDFSDIDAVRDAAEYCTKLPVHPRHPYAGELVYTAFSGSHQDAIKKGFAAMKTSNDSLWAVPYLPIDPADVGRTYEAVIRINSQSGKGGVAYVMEQDYGLQLPRRLQMEFSFAVQTLSDNTGEEVSSEEIYRLFSECYLSDTGRVVFKSHITTPDPKHHDRRQIEARVRIDGVEQTIKGQGNGPIDAYMHALLATLGIEARVVDYHQHAIGDGSDARSATYIELAGGPHKGKQGRKRDTVFGVGIDPNIVTSSLKALTSGLNRLLLSSAS